MFKRGFKIAVLGALGGGLFFAAYIVFLLPGGLRAYLEKRTDFDQLFVYHVGEEFIDIGFTGLDGELIHLSDYPHKVVLLNLFASWIGPCDAEAPRLERAWKTYRESGLVTVAIDVNETRERAQAFQRLHHLTFPVLLVTENIEGGFKVPFNLVIDKGGAVRFAGSGSQSDEMENVIAGLLGRGGAKQVTAEPK